MARIPKPAGEPKKGKEKKKKKYFRDREHEELNVVPIKKPGKSSPKNNQLPG